MRVCGGECFKVLPIRVEVGLIPFGSAGRIPLGKNPFDPV